MSTKSGQLHDYTLDKGEVSALSKERIAKLKKFEESGDYFQEITEVFPITIEGTFGFQIPLGREFSQIVPEDIEVDLTVGMIFDE